MNKIKINKNNIKIIIEEGFLDKGLQLGKNIGGTVYDSAKFLGKNYLPELAGGAGMLAGWQYAGGMDHPALAGAASLGAGLLGFTGGYHVDSYLKENKKNKNINKPVQNDQIDHSADI